MNFVRSFAIAALLVLSPVAASAQQVLDMNQQLLVPVVPEDPSIQYDQQYSFSAEIAVQTFSDLDCLVPAAVVVQNITINVEWSKQKADGSTGTGNCSAKVSSYTLAELARAALRYNGPLLKSSAPIILTADANTAVCGRLTSGTVTVDKVYVYREGNTLTIKIYPWDKSCGPVFSRARLVNLINHKISWIQGKAIPQALIDLYASIRG